MIDNSKLINIKGVTLLVANVRKGTYMFLSKHIVAKDVLNSLPLRVKRMVGEMNGTDISRIICISCGRFVC